MVVCGAVVTGGEVVAVTVITPAIGCSETSTCSIASLLTATVEEKGSYPSAATVTICVLFAVTESKTHVPCPARVSPHIIDAVCVINADRAALPVNIYPYHTCCDGGVFVVVAGATNASSVRLTPVIFPRCTDTRFEVSR